MQNNKAEDITWFCSLSTEHVLQYFLISLKKLAIQRVKISGHEEIADNFDLKMLPTSGLCATGICKKRVQFDDSIVASSVVHQLRLLDNCNLLRPRVEDTVDIEEFLTEICNTKSRRKRSR